MGIALITLITKFSLGYRILQLFQKLNYKSQCAVMDTDPQPTRPQSIGKSLLDPHKPWKNENFILGFDFLNSLQRVIFQ